MNEPSIQQLKTLPAMRPRQFSPITVFFLTCLFSFAPIVRASPQTCTPANGLVIETLAPNSILSRSGLQAGDVISYWEPLIPQLEERRQPDSVFDWFWFTDELLPRGPAKVTFIREGRFSDTIVFQGAIDARVRPVLPEENLLLYTRMAHLISNDSASEAARLAEDFFAQQRNRGSDLRSWAGLLTATAYIRSKDLSKAIEWYSRALDSTNDPLAQIYILQSIGIAYQDALQTREAETAYQAALAISQASWPGSLIETTSLKALYLLAWESRDLESVSRYAFREADILARQAPQSRKMADSLNILGVLASRAGDPAQAKAYHQQALTLRRAIVPESRDTARSLINLGNLELLNEDYIDARSLYLEALAILQKAAPESPEAPAVYSNLGRVESALGHLAEAERWHRAALEHTEGDVVGRLSTMRSLSYLAQKRGDFIRAEDWSRQAVEVIEKLAPVSSEMADALASLASIRFQMGDLERAKDLFESALSINQKISRGELDVASGLNNIASVLSRAGDYLGAEALWNKGLEILERRRPGGLSTARALHNIGEARRAKGDHETALGPAAK